MLTPPRCTDTDIPCSFVEGKKKITHIVSTLLAVLSAHSLQGKHPYEPGIPAREGDRIKGIILGHRLGRNQPDGGRGSEHPEQGAPAALSLNSHFPQGQ